MGETVKDMLVRQGLANGKPVGAGKVRGIGAGLPFEGMTTDPLTDAAAGGPRIRSGMGKGTPAETGASQQGGNVRFGWSRSPVLEVHTNPNMSGMPMTKRAKQTPFLICIEGGLA